MTNEHNTKEELKAFWTHHSAELTKQIWDGLYRNAIDKGLSEPDASDQADMQLLDSDHMAMLIQSV